MKNHQRRPISEIREDPNGLLPQGVQDQLNVQVFNETVPRSQEASIASPDSLNSKRAFSDTITRAQEPESPIQAVDHSRSSGGGSKQKWLVMPTLSDFVADVHITARKELTPSEFAYFQRTYFGNFETGYLGIADMRDPLDLTPDNKDKFFEAHIARYPAGCQQEVRDLDYKIRARLGQRFRDVGLHPQTWYFNRDRQDLRKSVAERIEIHNTIRRGQVELTTQA